MANSASTLIIPVENQVRELDAKLLLSCIAAERGFPVIIGSRAFVHFEVASIPRGVYLAKSMRSLSRSMFKILRMLGHEIVAWEEEALVHPPADTYFTLRLSPDYDQECFPRLRVGPGKRGSAPAVSATARKYAYPYNRKSQRGHIAARRCDPISIAEVERLRKLYGDFILINTNFTDVNPFIPSIGLFVPAKDGAKGLAVAKPGLE